MGDNLIAAKMYRRVITVLLIIHAALPTGWSFSYQNFIKTQFSSVRKGKNLGDSMARSLLTDSDIDSDNDVWSVRRKIMRVALKPAVKRRLDTIAKVESGELVPSKTKTPGGLVLAATLISISAIVLRLGGRVAFVQLLGLDFITDSSIKNQVDNLLSTFQDLGRSTQYLLFFCCWLVAKTFCIDVATVVLAISSGVLFGGLAEGTLASVGCSSAASLLIFVVSRNFFRERARQEIDKRPAYRAVDRACAREVFTLRVSPLLPIPVGAYNYLYSATSVSLLDFLLGISLGSIKPYLLDSYLGLFGKSILDDGGASGGFASDLTLLAFISVVILVGTFAAEVAATTWEEIQLETAAVDEADRRSLSQSPSAFSNTDSLEHSETLDNSLESAGFMKMFGLGADDIKTLPNWLQLLLADIFAAQKRVDTVIQDEVKALEAEIPAGIDVGWDTQSKIESKVYPGPWRNINSFEKIKPNSENVKEYTFESLVFSFSLIGAFIHEMSFDGSKMKSNGGGGNADDASSSCSPPPGADFA